MFRKERFSILLTSVGTAISRLLGFMRLFAIAYFLGAGRETDVLHLVFSMVNSFRKIIADGIFSSAIVPILTEIADSDRQKKERQKIIHNFFILQFFTVLPLVLLIVFFSDIFVANIFSFPHPEQSILGSKFLRVTIFYVFFLSLSATFIAIFHSHHRFFVPAIHPIIFSIIVIICIVALHRKFGILSFAFGTIIASVLQILLLVFQYVKLGYTFSFRWTKKHPQFIQLMKNSIPLFLTSLCALIAQQISISIASSLEIGSGTAMANALVFFQLPIGIFSVTFLVVFFPILSTAYNQDNLKRMGILIERVFSALAYTLFPTMLILTFFGLQIIQSTLEWGVFSSAASIQTGEVLTAYALGIPGISAYLFMQKLCFASKRYKQALYFSIFAAVVDILLTLWLKDTALRVQGIALAYSISYTVTFIIMFIYLRYKLSHFSIYRSFASCLRAAFCSLIALLPFLFFREQWTALFTSASSLQNVLLTIVSILIYLVEIILIYRMFSVDIFAMFKPAYVQEDA